MYIFIKENKEKFVFLFFAILFSIGIAIFDDYGIALDEDNSRINGFVSLKYIFEIFLPNKIHLINEIIEVPNINMHSEKGIGVVFDLPMAFIEYFFKVEDPRTFYLIRHFSNFLIFYVSVYFFYLIVKKRFDSCLMGLIGASFLIISPRIFAESFYNSKDLVFLSLFIISIYTAVKFLENPTLKNLIFFCLASAASIDLRILAIFLPLLVLFLYFIKNLRDKQIKKYFIRNVILLVVLLPAFVVIFWPYLWDDPFNKFFYIIQSFNYFDSKIYNLYLGKFISAEALPWHYPIVWQVITNPLIYVVLFIFGFCTILLRIIKRILKIEKNDSYIDLWRGEKELQDILFLFSYLIPLFIVINFNSSLYDGWRHLYFIYPSFLMISIFSLNYIRIKYLKKIKDKFYVIPIVLILPILFWMVKNHPHQNVYFNLIAGKKFNTLYEMDYWGLSNYHSINYILKNNNKKITIAKIGTTDLMLSKNFLKNDVKNKINIINNYTEADYIITNFRDWNGEIKDFESLVPENYEIYHQILVSNIPINVVYKKKD